MPYHIFLCQLNNLDYDNISPKLIFRKKQKFNEKNQSPDFCEIIYIFIKKIVRIDLISCNSSTNLSEKSELVFSDDFFKQNIDNFSKNHEIDFLHHISVFSQKSDSEEYYHSLCCILGM